MTQYDLWLDRIPDIGGSIILRFWKALGYRNDFAEVIYGMDPAQRADFASHSLSDLNGYRMGKNIAKVREAMAESNRNAPAPDFCGEQLSGKGIRSVCICDPDYPGRLRRIPDPPFALYYYGTLPSDSRPSVGMVGTRMASPYGREQARKFSMKLSENGIQIISGMARGIDGVAGKGALDGSIHCAGTDPDQDVSRTNAASFAVLGCGVDICYPRENLELYEALRDRGGIISEYPPGTEPEARLFPSRNRIISGLSDVILVIEAREKSGTMITVDQALEQGKDVFALPGRVSDRNSAGCNNLIRQGAGIALSSMSILDYFFGEQGGQTGAGNGDAESGGFVNRNAGDHYVMNTGRQMSFDFEVFATERTEENRERDETVPPGYTERTSSEFQKNAFAGLSRLGKCIYNALDESTPLGLEDIHPEIEQQMGRKVGFSEMLGAVTRLSVKGLVREVNVGNYVSVHRS